MRRSNRIVWIVLLVVALGVRLAAAWVWQARLEGPFGFGDSHSYWVLARSIAEGRPYEYGSGVRVFRTPGYPLLLAPVFWLSRGEPPVFWARVENVLFGTLAVVGVWWLARSLFDRTTAFVAACLAAVYPGAVATSVFVLAEAPFGPLMLLQLVAWGAASRAGSRPQVFLWAAASGVAGGAATLVRPSWLLFTPLGIALSVTLLRPRARQLAVGSVILAGLVVVMAPWWVRNWRVTGHFVPTTLQVGASLYDGWNPAADGSSNMRFVPRFVAAERRDPSGDPGEPFEYRLDQRLRRAALAWARQHPGRVVQLAAIKLVRMWNLWPNEPSLATPPVRLAVLLTYLPVLVLAVIGAVRTFRSGWPYVLCWLPAVYFTLLHMVFVSSIRYRQPAMLPLLALAAGTVCRGTSCVRRERAPVSGRASR